GACRGGAGGEVVLRAAAFCAGPAGALRGAGFLGVAFLAGDFFAAAFFAGVAFARVFAAAGAALRAFAGALRAAVFLRVVICVLLHRSVRAARRAGARTEDRKSTRLNSSHVQISSAVFCLQKEFYYA